MVVDKRRVDPETRLTIERVGHVTDAFLMVPLAAPRDLHIDPRLPLSPLPTSISSCYDYTTADLYCLGPLERSMAGKPRAPSTRASTRTKAATAAPAAPARTTRTASRSSTTATTAVPKKTATRKPLVNRANSPEAKTNGQIVSPKSSQNSGSILLPPDNDREPIKVRIKYERCNVGDSLWLYRRTSVYALE